MRRREFISLIGGAAAWPLIARAQQPAMPVVGFLSSRSPGESASVVAAFRQGLRETGFIEGQNLGIAFRWAEGLYDRLPALASELVSLPVTLLFAAGGPPSAFAAKGATSTIPIVFSAASDPVEIGLVPSLNQPGGNITGLSSRQPDTASKRLELLRELVPGLHLLAILTDVGNPFAAADIGEVRGTARTLGLEVSTYEIRQAGDIDRTFEALKGREQALYVLTVPLLFANRVRINTLALGARLPTMHGVREYVEAGGLMSYGPNWPHMWSRAADYVDKILRGAKPADIPVEQPTKFDLVVNLTTAKALGLTIPESFLLRADEVIE